MSVVVFFIGEYGSETVYTSLMQVMVGAMIYLMLLLVTKDELLFSIIEKIYHRIGKV